MTKFSKQSYWAPMTLFMIITCSCEKLVTVDPPPDQLAAETVFQNDGTAVAAIMGLYEGMIRPNLSFASSAMTLYPGMSADEFYNTTAGPYDIFSKNALSAGEPRISNLWSSIYNYIYQANSIIEGLAGAADVSSGTKARLTGEALFIRAFCHFYLVNLFGEVPLITSTTYQDNAEKPRVSKDQIYDQIIVDLVEAGELLAESPVEKVRPSKWCVATLLARVYLFQKSFDDAERVASAVIQSGSFQITDSLDEVFLANSPEAIWQLAPVEPGYNTWEGNTFIPTAGNIPFATVTNSLLNAFEPADKRRAAWIGLAQINGETYYYPLKYKIRVGDQDLEYYTVFRLAELYLIRAEARAQRNKLTGSNSAASDINFIRTRAGLDNITATTKEQILEAIGQERRIELFAEWGHRWFDLRRTGKADLILSAEKGGSWQHTDILYPIPAIEIEKNPGLTQNAGY